MRDSMIRDRHSCSYMDLSPGGISAVRSQYSWNVVGVRFWSLKPFKMFNDVVGPSSCNPPPWGTPSTMDATASLKSRRLTPCRSNFTGKTLRSSSLYRVTSPCGTLTTKHPSGTPATSGIKALLPSTTCPAASGAGSTQTMSPFRRPPASSTAAQQFASAITPGAAGGETAALLQPPEQHPTCLAKLVVGWDGTNWSRRWLGLSWRGMWRKTSIGPLCISLHSSSLHLLC